MKVYRKKSILPLRCGSDEVAFLSTSRSISPMSSPSQQKKSSSSWSLLQQGQGLNLNLKLKLKRMGKGKFLKIFVLVSLLALHTFSSSSMIIKPTHRKTEEVFSLIASNENENENENEAEESDKRNSTTSRKDEDGNDEVMEEVLEDGILYIPTSEEVSTINEMSALIPLQTIHSMQVTQNERRKAQLQQSSMMEGEEVRKRDMREKYNKEIDGDGDGGIGISVDDVEDDETKTVTTWEEKVLHTFLSRLSRAKFPVTEADKNEDEDEDELLAPQVAEQKDHDAPIYDISSLVTSPDEWSSSSLLSSESSSDGALPRAASETDSIEDLNDDELAVLSHPINAQVNLGESLRSLNFKNGDSGDDDEP